MVYNNIVKNGKEALNMKQRLLIWDIDGTLMTCGGSGRKAMNDAFYEVFNIENGFEHIRMAGRLDRVILRESLSEHHVSLSDESAFFSLYGHYLRQNLEINANIFVYEGVKEILEILSDQSGILCAVGTGNCEIGAYEKLKRVGLHEHFAFGGYGDHHDARDELIQHVIDQAVVRFGYQHSRESTFVIGDTPFDVKCGKNVGATTLAVATGAYTESELREHHPDLILNSLSDASVILKLLGL
jgi:phosphoglycolate phosphatase-like HAD superfamily hydrolase